MITIITIMVIVFIIIAIVNIVITIILTIIMEKSSFSLFSQTLPKYLSCCPFPQFQNTIRDGGSIANHLHKVLELTLD